MTRNYFKIIKSLVLFVILLLLTTGCGSTSIALPETRHEQTPSDETVIPNTWIFYRAEDNSANTNQIFKKMADGSLGELIFEFPQLYPTTTLPADEFAVLNHLYCREQKEDCSLENLLMQVGVGQFHLSPNKQWLVWNENIIGCANNNMCYGLHRLVTINIDHSERFILLEIPLHVDLGAEQSIDDLAWSPSNKQIAVVHSSQKGWSRVKIIDIETKQIVDFTDGNLPIAWSPNGERLALGFREAIDKMTVRVVLSDGTVETTIDNNWTSINNLDWSPDGSKLVVTASMEDMEYQFGVFIVDLTANDIAKVDLALDKPHSLTEAYWSPDGQLIGVTTSPTLVSPIDGLIVFDPEDGAIKANLKKGREVEKWFWSSDGNAILVNLSTAKRIGIYYWREDRLEELPPPSFLIEGLENGEVSIKTPVW